jgi:Putative transposase/Transposase zinc-binding domain
MVRPALEVADIFRRHGEAYRVANAGHLDRCQLRVMAAIETCRTAALGGHVERCSKCGHTQIAFNSCRNRHCPKCQSTAARDWLAARQADLLPVEYFHVVFTVPQPIAAIAYHNKPLVYAMLFEVAVETLRTIAADPKHLGAEIGLIAVLHTWGQTLTNHPHLHCIVPGGGLSPDGTRWIACRPGFFLPERVLSRLCRRLFLEKLIAAHRAGRLRFFGDLQHLTDPNAFAAHLEPLRRADWVVDSKRPFAGPEQVLRYLARYTHRVAISNHRLVKATDDRVTFTWKDYRHDGRVAMMKLAPDEFIRRFLLHVLPDRFQRIRHYGFLANGHRKAKLASIRQLLPPTPQQSGSSGTQHKPAGDRQSPELATPDDEWKPTCPLCGGLMLIIEILPGPTPRHHIHRIDTS